MLAFSYDLIVSLASLVIIVALSFWAYSKGKEVAELKTRADEAEKRAEAEKARADYLGRKAEIERLLKEKYRDVAYGLDRDAGDDGNPGV